VNLSTQAISFATQQIDTTSPGQSVILRNSGSTTLSIAGIATTGEFSQANSCGSSLAPLQACTITVKLSPISVGNKTGVLSISDNAPGSPHTVALNGVGGNVSAPPQPLTFTEVGIVPGQGPVAGGVGDFNRDGLLDVAIDGVTIYFGNGDGTFHAGGTFAANGSVVTAADFRGNGILDLVTVSLKTLSVLLGNGDGTFQTPTTYNFVNVASPIVVGDFNGDGHLDIAVGQFNTIDLMLGNGDGTFTIVHSVASVGGQGAALVGLATGDFNGDGKLDLVTSNGGCGAACTGDAVSILLGNGNGTFQAPHDYAVGGGKASPVVADFNSDGALDIAVIFEGTGEIGVLLGNGNGTFQMPVMYPTASTADTSGSLVATDLSGDGRIDIAVSDSNSAQNCAFAVLPGNGDGTFQAPICIKPGFLTGGLLTGDFRGIGAVDVVLSSGVSSPSALLFLNGSNITLSPTSITFGNQVVGTSSGPQLLTITNHSGVPLLLDNSTLLNGNGNFSWTSDCGSPGRLAPGAACSVSITFSPLTAGNLSGTWFSRDNTQSPPLQPFFHFVNVPLSGTGVNPPGVSLSPATLTFAAQAVGTSSAPQVITLTNSGASQLTINMITITGLNVGDFSQTNTCGTGVAASASCSISVTFTPTTTSARSASVTITDNASGSPQSLVLSGTGVAPAVGLSPTPLTFRNQLVGTMSAVQTLTMSNSGTAALSISSIGITGANAGDFTQTNTCGASVAASAGCSISVTFKPSTNGARIAAVTVTDNASGSPQAASISGTATDFSLGPAPGAPTSATFTAGQSATLNLQVNPVSGFTGAVNLACTGAPSESTCTPSASSATLSGASAAPFGVTVTTTARGLLPPGSLRRLWPRTPFSPLPYTILVLLCAFVAALKALRLDRAGMVRRWATTAAFMLSLATLIALSGCGGGGSSGPPPPTGTPAGTYTLTVTGTSQGQNRTVSLSLTVN